MTGSLKQLSTKSEIREQACEWVSRIDRQLDASEKQDLLTWLNASASHKNALYEMASLWDNLSVLEALVAEEQSAHNKQKSKRRLFFPMAAAVLCVAIIVSYLTIQLKPATDMVKHATQVGEQRTIVLSDNTSIKLNTATELDVLITDTTRKVVLHQGEAHFDIAKDPNRPFEVHAGDARFTAVGTAFNVSHWQDEPTAMIVTEGLVSLTQVVANNADSAPQEVVYPSLFGERDKAELEHGKDVQKSSLSPSDVNQALAWHDGMLLFSGETLNKALEQISRYSDVEFRIADPVLGERRIAGYFKAGDVEGLLTALEKNFDISHRKLTDNHILLSVNGAI